MSPLRKRPAPRGAIGAAFSRCSQGKRSAFIPFLVAGDPSLEATPDLLRALVAGGADVIELGVAFSDPIADGPTIQRASHRALVAGSSLSAVLGIVERHREELGVPIVLFTYYNPVHARGVEVFAAQAADSGVDGVLCVDLPPDEGLLELQPALEERGVDSIYLIAATSTRERIDRAAASSNGFVYYTARSDVTGERDDLIPTLAREVRRVRRRVRLPVAVGFGISTPEQVGEVARVAHGVVVGSSLVRLVEENAAEADLAARLERRVGELTAPLLR
ncbi:MAG: tryptophan synthase subunit alpha [Acidobacteria bacterium]|nr:tryptophan synthase subunit alpha [Acidobacteriota bacterium]